MANSRRSVGVIPIASCWKWKRFIKAQNKKIRQISDFMEDGYIPNGGSYKKISMQCFSRGIKIYTNDQVEWYCVADNRYKIFIK